jgi:hypothetical protein
MYLTFKSINGLNHSLGQSLHDIIIPETPSQTYPEVGFDNFLGISQSNQTSKHNYQSHEENICCKSSEGKKSSMLALECLEFLN